MKDILVIGSINLDYSISSNRFPKLGETVKGFNFNRNIGGKGLNQAVASFKFNANTYFCGAVGCDRDGDQIIQALNKLNMSTRNIVRTTASDTGIAVLVKAESDNAIIIHEGANGCLTIENIKQAMDGLDIGYVILQMELPYLITKEILHLCALKGIPVVLNPAPALDLDDDDYPCVDTLILNETEADYYAGMLSEKRSVEDAGKYFIEKGVRNVVITLGSKGSFYTDGTAYRFQPALRTKVIDTTGAGDAFVGVYVSALNEFGDIELALRYASYAGSMTCEKEGAMSASPYRACIESRFVEEKEK